MFLNYDKNVFMFYKIYSKVHKIKSLIFPLIRAILSSLSSIHSILSLFFPFDLQLDN